MVIKDIYTRTYIALVSFVCSRVVCANEDNWSLTFVIDNTDSMAPYIDEVIDKSDDIFDAIINSNVSQVDEFIIVTFNDPGPGSRPTIDYDVSLDTPVDAISLGVELLAKTNNRTAFKMALHGIVTDGGWDCEEMAISGIELAVQESKPNSFIFVLTDASAADYTKYEQVKSMAQEKSIQVTFLLTGACEDMVKERHLVYDRLSVATSGQVFHIIQEDISKIIEYILETMKNKRTVQLRKTYKDLEACNNEFPIDTKLWDILISLSAQRPDDSGINFTVTRADGEQAELQDFIRSRNFTIVKMKANPGKYKIDIEDCEEVTLVVSAATSVSFEHGFSPIRPSSLNETSKKPIFGAKAYLLIALDNKEGDVILQTVEIRNIDDKTVNKLELKLIDNKQQLYITDLFTPPDEAFKIAIIGYTKAKEEITRVSKTTIDYHKPTGKANKKPAAVSILKTVGYENNKPILKCEVQGFPKPQIWWEDEFHNILPSEVREIAPHEYISILRMYKTTKHVTLTCKAKNFAEDSDTLILGQKNNRVFNVLEYPKDVSVEYGKSIELKFKVNAIPPATITWYQNDKEFLNNNDVKISNDSSSLIISNAQPSLEGKYYVIAFNDDKSVKYEFSIVVTGKPKQIPASVNIVDPKEVYVEYDEPLTLKCKVHGFPKPQITWEDDFHYVLLSNIIETGPYEYMSILHIDNVIENATFICKASNFVEESDFVSVIIKKKISFHVLEYPKDVAVEYGNAVDLKCKIDAVSPATITWYREDKEITNNDDFNVSDDSTDLQIRNARPTLEGAYRVKATNGRENVEYKFIVRVTGTEIPRIDKNTAMYTISRESRVDLLCRVVQGKPEPKVEWSFYSKSIGYYVNISGTGQVHHINHVRSEHIGIYRCNVSNEIGMDYHEMKLSMQYPPTVDIPEASDRKHVKGEKIKVNCLVDGSPTPDVRWFVGDVEIKKDGKYNIYRDYTLSFTGTVEDSGNYTCEASNVVDTVRSNVLITIYEQPIIESPQESKFDAKLRSTLVLPCKVNGYPKPEVQWFYYSFKRKTSPKKIKCDDDYTVTLKNLKLENEGYYVCAASNDVDLVNITYTINIQVPATIKRPPITNKINAVEGDPELKLPCVATGSTPTTIQWMTNGIPITSGGRYEISSDGTLLVKNVTLKLSGIYICKAINAYGNDTMEMEVKVDSYPPFENNPVKLLVEYGTKKYIMFCGRHIKDEYLVRWYKNGRLIKTGNQSLTLENVTKADAAHYTCRVNIPKGYSYHKTVIIGTGPKFISGDNTTVTVQYEENGKATLDCSATGDPPPDIKWWQDKVKIFTKTSHYSFTMKANTIARYMCSVTNQFNTISRVFDITAGECLMSLENDFTARQPMLVTNDRKLDWPIFKISEGTLHIEKFKTFLLYCPNSSVYYDTWSYNVRQKTTCVGNSMFKLAGVIAKASDITCTKMIKPLARSTNITCLGMNTVLFNIGFEIEKSFRNVFDVCFNSTTKTPLFAKSAMHKANANTIPKHVAEYTKGTNLDVNFDYIYDCGNRKDGFSSLGVVPLKNGQKCCYGRLQLVNPRDVLPGISQVATYHYLNIVPQWSTCGVENWIEVERRVRLKYGLNSDVISSVWTGATSSAKSGVPVIYLKDDKNKTIPVPQYIWKVIDRHLAIIHINVAGLTMYDAPSYIICKDMCDEIDWMRSGQWHDPDKGYIFCCDIDEFERVFDYENIFV